MFPKPQLQGGLLVHDSPVQLRNNRVEVELLQSGRTKGLLRRHRAFRGHLTPQLRMECLRESERYVCRLRTCELKRRESNGSPYSVPWGRRCEGIVTRKMGQTEFFATRTGSDPIGIGGRLMS